ncbi:rhamnogalacturonan lyase [Actinoalloteichus sp. AHMU CJ021]|uniref:rhamnogalacturonan lyase family protein n=1 Tax=Actinoalloteichus sp. AHMU CJ021 TaxID=2072503 RepID=UPI000CA018B0|nr:rhamnogalacturonan lyase [Actinoalloteichus sp. AHMU CJ021]
MTFRKRPRRVAVGALAITAAVALPTALASGAAVAEPDAPSTTGFGIPRGYGGAEQQLGRGVIAVHDGDAVHVGWRLLETDRADVAFHLFRETDGRRTKLNREPITGATHWVDEEADPGKENTYHVHAVRNGGRDNQRGSYTLPAGSEDRPFFSFDLADDIDQTARHVAVGDLDGDGEMDYVIKRGDQNIDPSKGEEPRDTYKLEGYSSEGEFLWRRDLGVNLRTGIWYTPYLVHDLNGDGKAEVIYKSSEVDEDLNGDGVIDYRASQNWRVYDGPEYVEILDGATGETIERQDWIDRGEPGVWGDDRGNRSERNLMTVAYLDGPDANPSLITLRGTYAKMVAEAWDFDGETATLRWQWNRPTDENGRYPKGAGFHNLRTGDIDGDGRDEIINGSIAIDDDGSTLWITEEGHGDRVHMTDIDPEREGLEIFYVQEVNSHYSNPIHLRGAEEGDLLWGPTGEKWDDVGRGMAADIDPRHPGLEVWGGRPNPQGIVEVVAPVDGLYNARGERIGTRPASVNYGIWWDGDLLRELLDGIYIDKWDYENEELVNLVTAEADPFGGTDRYAVLGYGDVFGDWREEVFYVHDRSEIRIYTTTIPTEYRFPTLLHDRDYRASLAAESMGYMQSTQPGFYFGEGMDGT